MKTIIRDCPFHLSLNTRRSGMALVTVVFITTAMALIVGSLLNWGVSEQRTNLRHFVLQDSRNAVESATELACGVLAYRWDSRASVPENDLEAFPLEDEPAFTSAWQEVFDPDRYTVEVQGGAVTRGRFFIHPDDPANEDDPHKGKLVTIQSVNIAAMATVDNSSPDVDLTTYARQTLQVRDAPLFSHAVFYNMDLEFHPGPRMEMNGPVHANGDIWVQAVTRLDFTSNLTATGDFRYGYMLDGDESDPVTQSGRVYINNSEGGLSSPYRGSGSRGNINNYWDSQSPSSFFELEGYSNWGDFSMNRWNGNLQDSAHNVPTLNPIGYKDYVRDDPRTSAIDDDLNYAYALIEPNITDPTLSTGTRNPLHKGPGEKEKFAYKAGLTMRIHYSADGTTTSDGETLPSNAVRLYERVPLPPSERSNPDDPLNPNSTIHNLISGDIDINREGVRGDPSDYYVSFWKIDRDDPFNLETTNLETHSVQAIDEDGSPLFTESGDPVMETIETVNEIPVETHFHTDVHEAFFHDMVSVHPYREFSAADENDGLGDQGDPKTSMFDHRRQTGVDLIEVNMGNLRSTLHSETGFGLFGADTSSISDNNRDFRPQRDNNGVLYVEFPTEPTADPENAAYSARADRILPAQRESPRDSSIETGLILTNARQIPDPIYNQASNRDEGFTLATNGAMYVKGHYNADGDDDTGSNTAPDNSSHWDPNPPAALVADAIMPLSSEFGFLGTRNRREDASGFTEFNAAMVQGLRPTDKEGDGNISGGNHNFPRFLEDWGGVEFRYRGSMVALYESEVATQGTNTSYYSPPIRNWGFYELFGSGIYPPGTPNVRSFRKVNFRFLTKAEYDDLIEEMNE